MTTSSADDERLPPFMGWLLAWPGGIIVSVGACAAAASFLSAGVAHWIGAETWGNDCTTIAGRSCAGRVPILGPIVGIVLLGLATAAPAAVLWHGRLLGRIVGLAWSVANFTLAAVLIAAALRFIDLGGIDSSQSLSPIIISAVGAFVVLVIVWTVLYHVLKLFRAF